MMKFMNRVIAKSGLLGYPHGRRMLWLNDNNNRFTVFLIEGIAHNTFDGFCCKTLMPELLR